MEQTLLIWAKVVQLPNHAALSSPATQSIFVRFEWGIEPRKCSTYYYNLPYYFFRFYHQIVMILSTTSILFPSKGIKVNQTPDISLGGRKHRWNLSIVNELCPSREINYIKPVMPEAILQGTFLTMQINILVQLHVSSVRKVATNR